MPWNGSQTTAVRKRRPAADCHFDEPIRARAPEFNLLTAVMGRAVDDMATGRPLYAIDAYLWVKETDAWFVKCCDLLDMESERVAAALLERYGDRCEAMRAKRWRSWLAASNLDAYPELR